MADNLIFPIRFDLQKGVEEASKDWDKYAAQLGKEIQKRAVKVKLSLDTRNLDSLYAVKQRLAQLKIEPITPETKSAIKELAQELKQLAKALEQVQKYSSKNVGTSEVRSARVLEIEAKAAAAKELARQRAAKAEQAELKLAAAREKSAAAANRAATSVNNLTKAYGLQSSYIERLLVRLAALWSVRMVQSFLTNVRNVTAEFELQRVSLGAIIQDQQRANRLFSEIKTFALKSPVTILDLTKYTKQVAAYGIETEKLFDTTKRLADVSVGLGVDMGRLTLAYGQVKAASYLRAAEIRQFTEAGIPMLELLAKKFTELNGEMVTTEQVMDMVSKRGVDFKMVEEIFYDMTSAGGMFYNMQEKQGNTLYGMWSKLGDAASMMYDEIGNTEWVNEGMKAGIQFLTDLMKKWRDVAGSIAIISALYVKYRISAANAAIAEKLLSDATMQKVLALSFEKNALMQKMAMQTKTTLLTRIDNAVTLASIKAKIAAATATNIFTKALYSLKAALLSNPWTALFAAVAAAAMYLYNAYQEANKLRKELDNISAERLALTSQSVRNFEYLANAAVTAADGSKKQKDALDELHRTYRDMIPVEDLTIEKLRAMHGNYQQLTTSVREYIAAQQEQKAISEIQEEYAEILTKSGRAARNIMRDMGLSDTEIDRFFIHFNKVAENSVMSFRQDAEKAISDTGLDNVLEVKWHVLGGVEQMYGNPDIFALGQELMRYNEALKEQSNRLTHLREEYDAVKGELGEYQEALERVENLFNDGFVLTDITSGELVGEDTFIYQQGKINLQISAMIDEINNAKPELEEAGIELKEEWLKAIRVDEEDPMKLSQINFDEIIKAIGDKLPELKMLLQEFQKMYNNLSPQESHVQFARERLQQIVSGLGGDMDIMQKYLMKGGEDWKTYVKRIKKEMDAEILKLQQLRRERAETAKYGLLSKIMGSPSEDDIKKQEELAKELEAIYNAFKPYDPDKNKESGSKSDPRLQILNEMVQLAEKLNKEYSDWEKKVGGTQALEKVNDTYKETVKYAEKVAKEAGIKLPHLKTPTNAKELNEYLEAVRKVMETAKGLKGGKKAAIELAVKISNNVSAEDQKAIEEKLKALADKISRTKTAKEFYDKVLNLTGDYQLASNVSMSIYGNTGEDLRKQLADQIKQFFHDDEKKYDIEVPLNIIDSSNRINYLELEKFAKAMLDAQKIGVETYEKISKAAQDGQKDLAKSYEGYLKDLEAAKTYADKRIELSRYTAAKIREIEDSIAVKRVEYANLAAIFDPTEEQVARMNALEAQIASYVDLIDRYIRREEKEAAKLEYDAFKDTPLYVQMFEDLEHASTSTLRNMKQKLVDLQSVWGASLDPTQLKEIQSRLNEIDAQLAQRNPFKTLIEAYTAFRSTVKGYSVEGAEANVEKARAAVDNATDDKEKKAAETTLVIEKRKLEIAKQLTDEKGKQLKGQAALDKAAQIANDEEADARVELASAEAAYQKAVSEHGANSEEAKAAHEVVEEKKKALDIAQKTSEIVQKDAKAGKTLKERAAEAAKTVTNALSAAGDLAKGIASVMETMGADEEDVEYWNTIGDSINEISGGINDIVQAAMSADVAGVITSALTAIPKMISGFANLFSAGKVKKANKEIKRQQELLDQLEYTYSRLQKAEESALGVDYVANFKQQQKNLEAQAKAYKAQADAERSKGKKKDKDKIKEYENAYRETMDELRDMQGKIAEQMAGTDVASAARDFAQAWLEAYGTFGNTTQAIKEKFNDMLKNMVVESVMARTVQIALKPMFTTMDNMYKDGKSMAEVLAYAFEQSSRKVEEINNGLMVAAKNAEAAGVDIRSLYQTSDNLTGISRDIASASEEQITGLAAGINTQNYYISHVPRIAADVAVMRVLMEGGVAVPQAATGFVDLTVLQNDAMSHLSAISQHTAETVAECRRIAIACEEEVAQLRRVIVPRGAPSAFAVQVSM